MRGFCALWALLCGGCDALFGLDPISDDPTNVATMPGTWQVVAPGDGHVCGVRIDGGLYCWGRNDHGQLGVGAGAADIATPTQVGTLPWRTVSTRGSTTCAIGTDDSLWCWGGNVTGNVGDGSMIDRPEPFQIAGLWQSVATGRNHTCAIAGDGGVWCWGSNSYAQLGTSDGVGSAVPKRVMTTAALVTLTAGSDFTCGLDGGGVAWCWGSNSWGQLGIGTTASQSTPSPIVGYTWTAIAAGGAHICGRRPDGRLRCWGVNFGGQLGTHATPSSPNPLIVDRDAGDWVAVGCGDDHTCASKTDGTLWCWGANGNGQLGATAGATNNPRPTQVMGGARAWDQPAGGNGLTCALGDDHNLWCFGRGAASAQSIVKTPTQVAGNWKVVSAGSTSTCGIDDMGALYCWGHNSSGQIGDETFESRSAPKRVGAPSWNRVSVGVSHSCALDAAGGLYCWGSNYSGLGDGSTQRIVPTLIAGGRAFAAVSAGNNYTCSIEATSDRLYCWGNGYSGQLGLGTATTVETPTVVGTKRWSVIAAASAHTCGISSGTAYCWGDNYDGELGDNSTSSSTTPVAVGAEAMVETGASHTCGVDADGVAACWGWGYWGQLGTGTYENERRPKVLSGSWQTIDLGASFTCGISSDRSLSCWGSNSSGQLGLDDTASYSAMPVRVGEDADWTQVSCGQSHVCAIRADRSLWCWGSNSTGQLGIGGATNEGVPVLIP